MTAFPDGVLVVDKPSGPTSHDVVATARRVLRTPRIGHTGTLDPLATGVLVLVLGRATRLARFMAHDVKGYRAEVTFGRTTSTYDAAGVTTGETGLTPDRDAVVRLLTRLTGPQLQMPPAYSAKKLGGEVAHRAARRDAPLDLPAAPVTAHALTLVAWDDGVAAIAMEVSAGYYVRSFAHDLGQALGTGAYLSGLRRTRAGAFSLSDAVSWETLATRGEALASALVPLDRLVPGLPAAVLTPDLAAKARHGQSVQAEVTGLPDETGAIRLVDAEGHLVGIAEPAAARVGDATRTLLQPLVILG